MLRHSREPSSWPDRLAARTVRVLRTEDELAEAAARAAVFAGLLQDRLKARAARDARTAERRADR
jgi:hypothetical protein